MRFQWQMMDAAPIEMENANAMFVYILKVGLASGTVIDGISIDYAGLGATLIGFRCVDMDHSGGDPIFYKVKNKRSSFLRERDE